MKVRTFFKNLYYETGFGRILIKPFLILRSTFISQEILLKTRFKRMLGYSLNLSNPVTINEKIQWLKLNDRGELHSIFADKFKVREHIKNKIGQQYLIPLILETKNVADISSENLPKYPFIIKTNHDSGGITIIKDKAKINWPELRKKLKKQPSTNYDSGKGEWQYKDIEPRLVVEKLLLDENDNIPSDIKIHCMNGKVTFYQIDINRNTEHKRNLYDTNWELLPCEYKYKNGGNVIKPTVLDKMNKIAEKLAEEFIYVLVDLDNIEEKIYFGELTFHPESGFGKFYPENWDSKFGKLLRLPKTSIQNTLLN